MGFSSLGNAMIHLAERGVVNDYFTGWFKDGVVLRAETKTGSAYHVEIHPDGKPAKFEHSDLDLDRVIIYDIRPGAAVINGTRINGYVGHDMNTGTLLVLNDEKLFVRRSSTLESIVQLDGVSPQ